MTSAMHMSRNITPVAMCGIVLRHRARRVRLPSHALLRDHEEPIIERAGSPPPSEIRARFTTALQAAVGGRRSTAVGHRTLTGQSNILNSCCAAVHRRKRIPQNSINCSHGTGAVSAKTGSVVSLEARYQSAQRLQSHRVLAVTMPQVH